MPLTNAQKQARFRAKRRQRNRDLIRFVKKCHNLHNLRDATYFDIACEAAYILDKHNITKHHHET